MPEGDTIHRMAQRIAPALVDVPLQRLWTRERGELEWLVGAVVHRVEAVGKHLLVTIADTHVLRLHMGMRGRLYRCEPDRTWIAWDTSAILATAEVGLVWRNARAVELTHRRDRAAPAAIDRLGPDLLAPECDVAAIVARARLLPPETILAEVLLDQRIAAGIGNVYKSEVSFLVGVDPRTALAAVDDTLLERAYALARTLMQANVGGGPRDTVGPAVPRLGRDPRGRSWVYQRVGERCLRCGDTIAMARLGRDARSTYWCPTCQPPANPGAPDG